MTELQRLNDRDRAILNNLVLGLNNKAIGDRLGLSEKTIRNALTEIYFKLEVGNRTQAAMRWSALKAALRDAPPDQG